MEKKKVPASGSDSKTKDKILDISAELFAMKGFKAVTLKEVAKKVGVKIASLYYYYDDKDALVQDVVARFSDAYREQHKYVAEYGQNVESLDEFMDFLFNYEEFAELDPIMRFGMAMTLKEQHNHEYATEFALKKFYEESVSNVARGFDALIEKGIIPPSDTRTLATIFMIYILSENDMRLFEYSNVETPINSQKLCGGLRKLLTTSLEQGILQTDKE